jgi:hypothetical protein
VEHNKDDCSHRAHTPPTQTESRVAGLQVSDHFYSLSFGPTALAAAIARTATLQGAPVELLARFRDRALLEAEYLIEEGVPFTLSPNLRFLADAERTAFAGQVGAGITDIFMNALGYTWRDNAACLSSSLDPHADFIYEGGNAAGHGVVLVEAHGSFAANVTNATIGRRAKEKYRRQVKRWVASACPHGPVVPWLYCCFRLKARSARLLPQFGGNANCQGSEEAINPCTRRVREDGSVNANFYGPCVTSIKLRVDGLAFRGDVDRLGSGFNRISIRRFDDRIFTAPIRGPIVSRVLRSNAGAS